MARTNVGEEEKRRKSWFSSVQQTSELLTKNWLQNQYFFLLVFATGWDFWFISSALLKLLWCTTSYHVFLEKEEILSMEAGDGEVIHQNLDKTNWKKRTSVTIWGAKPLLQFEGLLISLWKAPKVGKWLKFAESFACYAVCSAITGISEELAFLLGFCTVCCGLYHIISLKNGKN